jgi:hypothetical protein
VRLEGTGAVPGIELPVLGAVQPTPTAGTPGPVPVLDVEQPTQTAGTPGRVPVLDVEQAAAAASSCYPCQLLATSSCIINCRADHVLSTQEGTPECGSAQTS